MPDDIVTGTPTSDAGDEPPKELARPVRASRASPRKPPSKLWFVLEEETREGDTLAMDIAGFGVALAFNGALTFIPGVKIANGKLERRHPGD